MSKRFNITGTCIPHKHYMADTSEKIKKIIAMVEAGEYFTINKPRQYGKTTTIYLLDRELKKRKDYLVLKLSFEGIDTTNYEKHQLFIRTILNIFERRLDLMDEKELTAQIAANKNITDFSELNAFLTKFIQEANRKVILIVDEVDKSANNQLFLDFLGMLRSKYLSANEGEDYTFHSVILAGVHDVKTLKAKIRTGEKRTYNSPWNIAVDFDIDLSLSSAEITSMLEDYAVDREVKIDVPFFAEKLFYLTSGYPFLVSCLCKIIDEEIPAPGKPEKWEPGHIEQAVRIALMKDNTNFGTLIKNLENNPDLYEFVFEIIMNGREFSFNLDNPVIHFGGIYGILRREAGKTKIHNRLYEQRIYNYMASKMETSGKVKFDHVSSSYYNEDGTLHIEKVIGKFRDFIKEQYSKKDRDFLERNGRLMFLAFLRPIINGRGFDFKEVQISEEKRLDIVITMSNKKYIIELKVWRGEAYHQKGIEQLCDYLDRQNEKQGYLLIYDLRRESGCAGTSREIEAHGKKILSTYV
ncbi:MAG: AAA family ATPase [Candidatus Aminicenantes bacterium]|nr:AAA family ATPase [Candidatus Aminicenantes bacterium]